MAYPTEYKYTKEHEWLAWMAPPEPSASPTTRRTPSVTSSSSSCPRSAPRLTAGKTFGTVESVKAVSDLYAPVSGNRHRRQRGAGHLARKGQHRRPHTAWMVKLTLTNPSEVDALLSADDYEKFIAAEEAGH